MKVKQIVIIMAYNWEGILLCDRVATGTVNDNKYVYFLRKKLHPQIRKMQPMLLQAGVITSHNNERPHHKDYVLYVFSEYGWEILPHPPYSPDTNHLDYNLFQKLKEPLRGVHFCDLTAFNNAVRQYIYELNSGKPLNSIQRLPKHCTGIVSLKHREII